MKLSSSDFQRRKYARKQCTAKGTDMNTDLEAIPELMEMTYAPDPKTRIAGVQYLCPCHVQRNRPEVWDRIFELARDPDLSVRKTVFHILGDGSPNERREDVIKTMESMFHDPDLKLRRRVRQFLAQYRHTGKINIL